MDPMMIASSSGQAPAATSGFPVRTRTYRRTLLGVPTDFSFSMYANTTLLFVSQVGTAGTLFSASSDAAFDGATTYTTQVLLGTRDAELLQIAVRQIVEMAGGAGYRKPMVVGLGLKAPDTATVKAVVAAVAADNVWG